MNWKQSAKAAEKTILDLEETIVKQKDFNMRASADIKNLYRCCLSVIAGEKTFCDWCEERNECQRECKGKTGCAEWWMDQSLQEKTLNEKTEGGDGQDGGEDKGFGFLQGCSAGGEGA